MSIKALRTFYYYYRQVNFLRSNGLKGSMPQQPQNLASRKGTKNTKYVLNTDLLIRLIRDCVASLCKLRALFMFKKRKSDL